MTAAGWLVPSLGLTTLTLGTGAQSMLTAAPLDLRRRTRAVGLGVLIGPAALGEPLTCVLAYVASRPGTRPEPQDAFRGAEYLQLPLLWRGAGLLGLATARWLPWPGAPRAVCLGLVTCRCRAKNQTKGPGSAFSPRT